MKSKETTLISDLDILCVWKHLKKFSKGGKKENIYTYIKERKKKRRKKRKRSFGGRGRVAQAQQGPSCSSIPPSGWRGLRECAIKGWPGPRERRRLVAVEWLLPSASVYPPFVRATSIHETDPVPAVPLVCVCARARVCVCARECTCAQFTVCSSRSKRRLEACTFASESIGEYREETEGKSRVVEACHFRIQLLSLSSVARGVAVLE